nr:hypothetical protein [Candidatus Sigynarchaeota archaeon]
MDAKKECGRFGFLDGYGICKITHYLCDTSLEWGICPIHPFPRWFKALLGDKRECEWCDGRFPLGQTCAGCTRLKVTSGNHFCSICKVDVDADHEHCNICGKVVDWTQNIYHSVDGTNMDVLDAIRANKRGCWAHIKCYRKNHPGE